MSWQGIEGHDAVVEQFRRALERGRLASTFLFVGPPGIGKRTFALKLAQTLLCQRRDQVAMNPCGDCANCVQVLAGTHPDLLEVRKRMHTPLIFDGRNLFDPGTMHELGFTYRGVGRRAD